MKPIAARPNGLLTSSTFEIRGMDPRRLRRGVAAGDYVRIKKGAYCAADEWAAMSALERHIMLVHAVAESNPDVVFSHWSAAALRGLPIFGRWPAEVHVLEQRTDGGRSEPYVRKHCLGYRENEIETIDGALRLTTSLRTAIDMGAGSSFETAVILMDAALHRDDFTRSDLVQRLAEAKPHRGGRVLARAGRFSDGLSESPGESLSRVRIHQLGFPQPELQKERVWPDGRVERPDFDWPAFRLIGEFDGKGKYLKPEYLGSMTPGEAVYAEKRREDRFRSVGDGCARWGWPELMQPDLLARILLDAGLSRQHL
ncbi:type IV toxin-antitoxin system AbiEi family antitoxin domain-containing protein [Microbacteriaceae bacterium VKM Ac-2855]|nr:type IV toxin-antitoxin system AbiEi family antitoxin domain-containing protein [Microbacteriaceae bacterium VKM Ac-2855]